jgi:hypothetical protein
MRQKQKYGNNIWRRRLSSSSIDVLHVLQIVKSENHKLRTVDYQDHHRSYGQLGIKIDSRH